MMEQEFKIKVQPKSLNVFCKNYILKNEPKKPKLVHQNCLRKTTQTISKTDHA